MKLKIKNRICRLINQFNLSNSKIRQPKMIKYQGSISKIFKIENLIEYIATDFLKSFSKKGK